jgi:hypothetical protein
MQAQAQQPKTKYRATTPTRLLSPLLAARIASSTHSIATKRTPTARHRLPDGRPTKLSSTSRVTTTATTNTSARHARQNHIATTNAFAQHARQRHIATRSLHRNMLWPPARASCRTCAREEGRAKSALVLDGEREPPKMQCGLRRRAICLWKPGVGTRCEALR